MRLSCRPSPGKVGGRSHKHPSQDFSVQSLLADARMLRVDSVFEQVGFDLVTSALHVDVR
jgi:hypothetical protein